MSGAGSKQAEGMVSTMTELWAASNRRARQAEAMAALNEYAQGGSDPKVGVVLAVEPRVDAIADGGNGYGGSWAEPFEVAHVSKLSREILRARAALERARLEERRAKDKAEGLAKLVDHLVSIKVVHGDTPVRLKKVFSVEVVQGGAS